MYMCVPKALEAFWNAICNWFNIGGSFILTDLQVNKHGAGTPDTGITSEL